MASLESVPAGVSTIELHPGKTPLDEYIKAESYTLYTEVTLRWNVAQELTVRADSRFRAAADPV